MQERERVGIYCDAVSLWYYAKQFGINLGAKGKCRVDYERLKPEVARGRLVTNCVAYLLDRENTERFSSALTRFGYRTYRVAKREDVAPAMYSAIMGDIDADPSLRSIAIVTGDGDYAELIYKLKDIGVKAELHSFPVESRIIGEDAIHPQSRFELPEHILEELEGEPPFKQPEEAAAKAALASEARARRVR